MSKMAGWQSWVTYYFILLQLLPAASIFKINLTVDAANGLSESRELLSGKVLRLIVLHVRSNNFFVY